MRMQTILVDAKAEVDSTLSSSLVPSQGPGAQILTIAVLADGCPAWLAALAGQSVRLLCVGADGAALLPQDQPDILFVDDGAANCFMSEHYMGWRTFRFEDGNALSYDVAKWIGI